MSGFNRQSDLYGELQNLIRKEIKWLKHYSGKVLSTSDPLNKRRVQVAIEELGWNDGSMGLWAFPRDMHAQQSPKVGEWVEIYFMMGDPARPVYMGLAWEQMQEIQTPNYTSANTQVLFQDPDVANDAIIYDKQKQQFSIPEIIEISCKDGKISLDDGTEFDLSGKTISLIGGTEPFVLGNSLNSYLTTMTTTINTALAAKLDGGGTPGTLTPPSGILSTSIKGK